MLLIALLIIIVIILTFLYMWMSGKKYVSFETFSYLTPSSDNCDYDNAYDDESLCYDPGDPGLYDHGAFTNYFSDRDSTAFLLDYTNFPFYNIPLGSRRNMSYDLRGDIPNRRYYVGPWNNSSRNPIYNVPLSAIS